MPTYDYQCDDCGHVFEAFQRMSEAPLTECPECGGQVKRKIGTGAGLIFKGSGFYITDYKDGKKTSKSKTNDGSEKKSKESSKTASKNEVKTGA